MVHFEANGDEEDGEDEDFGEALALVALGEEGRDDEEASLGRERGEESVWEDGLMIG